MGDTGKNYRKGDPLRGAAILMLSLEKQGLSDQAARGLMQGTFADLGVKEAEVRKYLKKNRAELERTLVAQSGE